MITKISSPLFLLAIIGFLFVGEINAQQQFDFTSAQYIYQVPQNLHSSNSMQLGAWQNTGKNDSIHHRITAEALFLGRSNIDGPAFVFDDNGDALSYSDLSFGLETGYRFGYGFFANSDSGLEFLYSENTNTLVNAQNGPNVTPLFFNGIPADPVNSYDVSYDTDLESFEVNFWARNRPGGRIGIGARFFRISEQFDIIETSANTRDGFFANTGNDLAGLQIMLDERRTLYDGIRLHAGLKAGGYGNDIDLFAEALNAETVGSDGAFSFNLDFWAGIEMQFDGITQLRFGYQGLFFSNIALAPAQSEALSIFNPINDDLLTQSVTYHGLYLGANLTF